MNEGICLRSERLPQNITSLLGVLNCFMTKTLVLNLVAANL